MIQIDKIQIHIHGCVAVNDGLLSKLDEIIAQQKEGNSLMSAIRQDILDVIAKFDAATTAISDRIDRLIQASTGLTADEKAAFQAEADKLDAMGKDPANPTP